MLLPTKYHPGSEECKNSLLWGGWGIRLGRPESLWIPCQIPGGAQGQAGRSSGKSYLVKEIPIHSSGVGIRWSVWSLSTQIIPLIPWFYDLGFTRERSKVSSCTLAGKALQSSEDWGREWISLPQGRISKPLLKLLFDVSYRVSANHTLILISVAPAPSYVFSLSTSQLQKLGFFFL